MIAQLQQAFREEAAELLAELEGALLEMVVHPTDGDLINRIFRALHTIKGSSGMFGYDVVAALTHEIETCFEDVRKGGSADRRLLDSTLRACDLIRGLLREKPGDEAFVPPAVNDLIATFRVLAGGVSAGATAIDPLPNPISPEEEEAEATWLITFRPDRQTFKRGINPLQLLNELRELGPCRISAHTDQVPPLSDLDPELCYLCWDIVLTTRQPVEAIHDVFMFIGEESSVTVTRTSGAGRAEEVHRDLSERVAEEEAPLLSGESAERRDSQAERMISSIRVGAEKLDQLVNLVGELVTAQARLSQTAAIHDDPALISLAEEIERLTAGLRDTALNIRMIPIGGTFARLRRLVHDLAPELGKNVELVTDGTETELDKTVIERLTDPLVHLIRNGIDHGIESAERRIAVGKSPRGTIRLSASYSGDSVLLSYSDDGAGINTEKVHARGVAMGLIAEGAELLDRDLLNLIFTPGFSTSSKVTNISGRGVGMDVVKRGVEALRGTIGIASKRGQGTTITIKIPLTLALIESLLVQIGHDCFVLPLSLVEECVELTREEVARTYGRQLVNLRGAIIPYIVLRDWFGIGGARPEVEQIVIVAVDGKQVGLVVDHVIGGHQTVIKSLGRTFRETPGISGATILGDGSVALIMDVPQLVGAEELSEKRKYRRSIMATEGDYACMMEQ